MLTYLNESAEMDVKSLPEYLSLPILFAIMFFIFFSFLVRFRSLIFIPSYAFKALQ